MDMKISDFAGGAKLLLPFPAFRQSESPWITAIISLPSAYGARRRMLQWPFQFYAKNTAIVRVLKQQDCSVLKLPPCAFCFFHKSRKCFERNSCVAMAAAAHMRRIQMQKTLHGAGLLHDDESGRKGLVRFCAFSQNY